MVSFFINVRSRRRIESWQLPYGYADENKFQLFVQQKMHSIVAQRICSLKCGILGTISSNFEKKRIFANFLSLTMIRT